MVCSNITMMYIIMNKVTALIVICNAMRKKKQYDLVQEILLVCSSSVINYKDR